MNQEQIRNTVITSIFSNDILLDKLTLKGGNALDFQGVTDRASQDIDFAITDGVNFNREKYGPMIKKSLIDGFAAVGYEVINFKLDVRPQKKSKVIEQYNNENDFKDIVWEGYYIKFGIIQKEKYEFLIKNNVKNIGAQAETTWGNKKNIEIDLSKGEYTDPREEKELDGYTIYIYTPIMLVYEKMRASCQQLPQYTLGSPKERARDLFDIYEIIIQTDNLYEQVLNPENIYILKKMFILKGVSFKLLTKLSSYKEELAKDYKNNVLPQIRSDKNKQDFDFIFSFAEMLFKQVYELVMENQ
ncbi:MAG: nucleotidyl transferase AbiEii/AbiGii toxin family protein [Liquorilactobacillus ghanensis]|uniref:nucleotidyl transferase AbiEii/AbiGii toxin family protein n=1 Tax=Liquorilactobacillus ghanensis TaxID=399370 RepID=UPI0039EC2551